VRGNGLGLTWCREVLEHFGGGISAKRHEDGLEMIVRLSRA
jgi:C4-dicarboxylate-specific signal transduction histidine kinase